MSVRTTQETCPNMPHKPAFMCANRLNTCWSVGKVFSVFFRNPFSIFQTSSFFRLILIVLERDCAVLMAVSIPVKSRLLPTFVTSDPGDNSAQLSSRGQEQSVAMQLQIAGAEVCLMWTALNMVSAVLMAV